MAARRPKSLKLFASAARGPGKWSLQIYKVTCLGKLGDKQICKICRGSVQNPDSHFEKKHSVKGRGVWCTKCKTWVEEGGVEEHLRGRRHNLHDEEVCGGHGIVGCSECSGGVDPMKLPSPEEVPELEEPVDRKDVMVVAPGVLLRFGMCPNHQGVVTGKPAGTSSYCRGCRDDPLGEQGPCPDLLVLGQRPQGHTQSAGISLMAWKALPQEEQDRYEVYRGRATLI